MEELFTPEALAAVERIEVIRGPGSVLYGSDAMGGVVNILSVAPGPSGPFLRYSGQVTSADPVLATLRPMLARFTVTSTFVVG